MVQKGTSHTLSLEDLLKDCVLVNYSMHGRRIKTEEKAKVVPIG